MSKAHGSLTVSSSLSVEGSHEGEIQESILRRMANTNQARVARNLIQQIPNHWQKIVKLTVISDEFSNYIFCRKKLLQKFY